MRSRPALIVTFRGETAGPLHGEDLVATFLDDFRPSAIQEEPGAWHVFFPTAGARDAAAIALIQLGDRVGVQSVDVADGDWARRSQADLGPVVVGNLIVTPPWAARETASVPSCARRRPPGLEKTQIVILPSRGFGSGHHASTRLCLRLLQQVDVTGWSVADIGTGSGVLAIAARRLGAASVVAVDDDPDALSSARENLELNGLRGGPRRRRDPARGFPVASRSPCEPGAREPDGGAPHPGRAAAVFCTGG